MLSKFALAASVAAICFLSSSCEAGSGVPAASAFLQRQRSLARAGKLNLYAKGGDDDNHNDPDAYVPQGKGKESVTNVLSSLAMTRLSLRGGSASASEVKSADPKLQIVFVSAEIAPWSVTGGLGAVCDGLPRAMAKAGHRVMSIAPRYDQYYDAWDTEFTAEVPLGESTTTVRFFHAFKKGVDRVFVDHPLFLEKVWGQTKQKLYGPKWGKDY